ncbi:hypothetical protein B0A54_12500 [Friedmanniomyces endolithicus]|uniref:Uncharacterized protein n=1 Tax=Friedmanniomyces endolithicus TaxID=329885 RepID=A0A4U0UKJ3_9PEZI|nr:hypothetical protein B0A54_12500 [Friedmanniomyces endolithicus]
MFPDLELGQQLYPAPQQEQQQVFTQASEPVMHGMPLATHDPAVQAFHGQATNQQPAIRGGMAIQQFPHDMAIDPQQGMCSGPSMQRYPHESAALRPQHHRADIHGLPMAYNQTGTAMQLTGSTYPSQA